MTITLNQNDNVVEMTTETPIYKIAQFIKRDWAKVNFAAKPYLDAMMGITSVHDNYGYDSANSIILYFLCNASQYRGENAKQIKKLLKKLTK